MKTFQLITALVACSVFALFAGDAQVDDEAIPERGGMGTVTIKTDPEGSMVYLDGQELGKTPIIKKQFRSGRVDLVIIEEGRRQQIELVNTRFNIWPNKENIFETKTRMPWGNIELTTNPGKCQVLIDGDNAGSTEGSTFTMHNLREGDHLIEINCGGSRRADTLVRVIGEETVKINLDATKKRR